jgi:choline transport protein
LIWADRSRWTSTLAWQAGNAIGVFLVGTLVQSIISINDASYTFPSWQATLLVIAAVAIAFSGNVFGYKILHAWQNVVFCCHVMAYFAFIIPIWVNAPRATHEQVWTNFENNGGWYSPGFAVLVGQLSGIYTQLGLDTVSSQASPRGMLTIIGCSYERGSP